MSKIAATIVEVCVFKIEKRTPRYLLLQRAETEKLYPGIWQFVTGSIEKGEKAVDAALREVAEETGLKPKAFWVVPYVNSFYDPNWDSVNLSPAFAAEVVSSSKPALSDEHSMFQWCGYNEAMKKLVWPGQRECLKITHEYIVKNATAGKLTRILLAY